MNIYTSQRGFTLIELLVVIAIIGILAGIVLASLGSARSGGTDAKLKTQLSSMRGQAEFYTGATTAFAAATPCVLTANTLFGSTVGGLGNLFGGLTLANTRCAYVGTTLPSVGAAWAVAAQTTSGAWCVDSTGWSSDKNRAGTAYVWTGTPAGVAAIAAGTFTCV